jgi:hypothetical protein
MGRTPAKVEGTSETPEEYQVWANNECPSCRIVFDSRASRNHHLFLHRPRIPPRYACLYCAAETLVFDSCQQLTLHVHSLHLGIKRINCPKLGCNRSFANKGHANEHAKEHSLARYSCRKCPAVYQRAYELKRHQIRKHEIPPNQYPCPHCEERFHMRSHLMAHIPCEHPTVRLTK